MKKIDWKGWLGKGLADRRRIRVVGVAVGLLAALVIAWLLFGGDDGIRYRTAKIEKGTIVASVSSSGTIKPVISVQVGSQVSGQIKELYVDFNSEVKKDQLIAQIDPETFEYKVRPAC